MRLGCLVFAIDTGMFICSDRSWPSTSVACFLEGTLVFVILRFKCQHYCRWWQMSACFLFHALRELIYIARNLRHVPSCKCIHYYFYYFRFALMRLKHLVLYFPLFFFYTEGTWLTSNDVFKNEWDVMIDSNLVAVASILSNGLPFFCFFLFQDRNRPFDPFSLQTLENSLMDMIRTDHDKGKHHPVGGPPMTIADIVWRNHFAG